MIHLTRAIAASVLGLVTLGALVVMAPISSAEVSVRTDRAGQYLRTQVIPTGDHVNPEIWSVRSRGVRFRALNPRGDLKGDLWPTVVDSSRAPHHPWAVWSEFRGDGHKLVWARWTDRGWSDAEQVARVQGSDYDPDLAFDASGRAHVVWWSRGEDGHGDIYVSVFLINRWMEPFKISHDIADARYPSIDVEDDGGVRITYYTPNGMVVQYLSIALPVTITDDINPQAHVVSESRTFKAYKP